MDKWLYGVCVKDIYDTYHHMDYPVESQCCLLVEEWRTTKPLSTFLPLLTKLNLYNNLEKKEFLTSLYACVSLMTLPSAQIKWLNYVLPLDEQTCENR